MGSRRSFIEKVGKGAAFSSLMISSPLSAASQLISEGQGIKPLVIGIIGAENSHTAGFGKLFNIERAFPGVEVKYVWGETEEFAKKAMKDGAIPNRVKDPTEMLGKIDALIVDHRHGKYHLEAATPFIKAGIPTFIDKPFCYRLAEGKKFLALARDLGTPVTSYSSIAHSYETFDIKKQVSKMGDINQVVRYGPIDLDSEYGGVFFYGAHTVQPLLYIFGNKVQKVRITKNGKNSGANLVFQNGMLATLVFTTQNYGWETHIESKDGITKLKSDLGENVPAKNYVDMVNMFKTGIEPRSHDSILHGVAVLEALEKSVSSGQWENVEP
jgi:hypothetical protein